MTERRRKLNFIVTGQTIKKDPRCDFSGIVSGTRNYLVASFTFSKEWETVKAKVAEFSVLGAKFKKVLNNNECVIPSNALLWTSFDVRVIGTSGISESDIMFVTDEVQVLQQKGKPIR